MKKIGMHFIILSFAFACTHNNYDAYNNLACEFTEQLKKENPFNPWFPLALGSSADHEIDLSFLAADDDVDISKARAIIVEGVDKLINKINNSPKIKPHLSHVPITYHDLSLGVLFINREGYFAQDASIVEVVLERGKLYFYTNPKGCHDLAHAETYEEALELVKNYTISDEEKLKEAFFAARHDTPPKKGKRDEEAFVDEIYKACLRSSSAKIRRNHPFVEKAAHDQDPVGGYTIREK